MNKRSSRFTSLRSWSNRLILKVVASMRYISLFDCKFFHLIYFLSEFFFFFMELIRILDKPWHWEFKDCLSPFPAFHMWGIQALKEMEWFAVATLILSGSGTRKDFSWFFLPCCLLVMRLAVALHHNNDFQEKEMLAKTSLSQENKKKQKGWGQ